MNSNLIASLVIGAIVILGGIALVVYKVPVDTTALTATTTVATVSSGVSETMHPTTPLVTTGTQVVASNSTAVVTGKVVPNGFQTSYWYEYGRGSGLGIRTDAQSIGSGYNSITAPAIISGLSANTVYYYRLSAMNAGGTGTGQTYSFTTNTDPQLQGVAPTTRTIAASTLTRTTANLNGQVTANSTNASYWFEYGETSDFGNTTAFQSVGTLAAGQNVSISVSDLKPATKYYFRMNAQNQYGTVNGAIMNFTTAGPVAILAPTVATRSATDATASTATLHGTVAANGASTIYWFEYSSDPLLGSLLNRRTAHISLGAAGAPASVQADVTNLSSSTKYYFHLVAENSAGTVYGNRMSFNTK